MGKIVRFAICDDDEDFAARLAEELKASYKASYYVEGVVCEHFINGEQLINAYANGEYDTVFMDIEVGDDIGFDIARRLVEIDDDLGIVYVTSYDHYATEAFVCRPLGFIRKDKLTTDVERTLYSVNSYIEKKSRVYTFHNGHKSYTVSINNVKLVQVYDHDFEVITNETKVIIKDKMKRVEDDLVHLGFIKVSRSCMINMRYIREIDRNDCVLDSGERFNISKERVTYAKNALIKYRIMH